MAKLVSRGKGPEPGSRAFALAQKDLRTYTTLGESQWVPRLDYRTSFILTLLDGRGNLTEQSYPTRDAAISAASTAGAKIGRTAEIREQVESISVLDEDGEPVEDYKKSRVEECLEKVLMPDRMLYYKRWLLNWYAGYGMDVSDAPFFEELRI